jgi:hypothetical protein
MPVIDNVFKDNVCFTIMDGPFVSAYQTSNQGLSLFGVLESPYFKTTNLDELELKNLYNKTDITDSVQSLLNTAKKYFKGINQEANVKHVYFSPKVKIRDDIDSLRTSGVIIDNNVISVLCGKISSIVSVYEQVKRLIDLQV